MMAVMIECSPSDSKLAAISRTLHVGEEKRLSVVVADELTAPTRWKRLKPAGTPLGFHSPSLRLGGAERVLRRRVSGSKTAVCRKPHPDNVRGDCACLYLANLNDLRFVAGASQA